MKRKPIFNIAIASIVFILGFLFILWLSEPIFPWEDEVGEYTSTDFIMFDSKAEAKDSNQIYYILDNKLYVKETGREIATLCSDKEQIIANILYENHLYYVFGEVSNNRRNWSGFVDYNGFSRGVIPKFNQCSLKDGSLTKISKNEFRSIEKHRIEQLQ